MGFRAIGPIGLMRLIGLIRPMRLMGHDKKRGNRLFFLSNNNLLLEHVAVVVVQMDDVDAAADAADR